AALRSATRRKTSLPVSAHECAASATSEADPVSAAAIVFATATAKFAANAITTVSAEPVGRAVLVAVSSAMRPPVPGATLPPPVPVRPGTGAAAADDRATGTDICPAVRPKDVRRWRSTAGGRRPEEGPDGPRHDHHRPPHRRGARPRVPARCRQTVAAALLRPVLPARRRAAHPRPDGGARGRRPGGVRARRRLRHREPVARGAAGTVGGPGHRPRP